MYDTNQQFDNYNPESENCLNENEKLTAEIKQLEDERRMYIEEKSLFRQQIEQLEDTFKHYHVNKGDGTDTCKECGLNLRDSIHIGIGGSKMDIDYKKAYNLLMKVQEELKKQFEGKDEKNNKRNRIYDR